MKGQKPPPAGYPTEVRTLGDHLRKRRLDLGLRQKDVAKRLKVNKDTIRNWELGRATPAVWQWPGIIRLLGYVPFGTDGGLPERLKAYRRIRGVSQKNLAGLIGVDESTLWHWERGRSRPNAQCLARLYELLGAPL